MTYKVLGNPLPDHLQNKTKTQVSFSEFMQQGTIACGSSALLFVHLGLTLHLLIELSIVQWSLDYKTTPWDGRKWSYIAGGLLIKG